MQPKTPEATGMSMVVLVTLTVALSLAGCTPARPSLPSSATLSHPGPTTESSQAPPAQPTPAPAASSSASALLATLTVRPAAGHAGYSRAAFGPAWADVDHNGCDTRNDILNRDLTGKTWRDGTHDCVVISGTLADPYTGTAIAFVKSDAIAVQIDHVVALANAWSDGASAWSATRREQFANDPLELLAVSGPTNEAKGDADASAWLPPNTGFTCSYVTRQVDVKAAYGLSVTAAERDAMAAVLTGCGRSAAPATTVPG